jgi:hypothetical protein
MDFDQTLDEFAQWTAVMPDDWDAGTVTAIFYWVADSASTNSVVWGMQGIAYGDSDPIDAAAWGLGVEVTDANNAQNDMNISGETGNITVAGTPAAGEAVQFRVYRNANAANDDLAADARLVAVRVTFTRT